MSAYNTAVSILKNNVGIEIPPEIYNNMAALHFWQGNLDEAKVTVVTGNEMGVFLQKVGKWGCFVKKVENGGCFFVKKVDNGTCFVKSRKWVFL